MTEGNGSIAGQGKVALVALVLAGCAGSVGDFGSGLSDAGNGGAPCQLSLIFDPPTPIAGPTATVRVSSTLSHTPGVFGYNWSVLLNGATIAVTPAQMDNSEISFRTPTPGIYFVSLDVLGGPAFCSSVVSPISVRAPGAQSELFRLRVVPPQTVAAPLFEKSIVIDGGASVDLGIVGIDRGIVVNPLVTMPGGGVPAYLQFAPNGAPGAVVEGFADASGYVVARLLPQPHTVVIVPAVAGAAPRRIANWSPSNSLLGVDAGSLLTGTVSDSAGAPLSGVAVQLTIDGVPSTLAMTASDGSFAVHAVPVAGATVIVEATPPKASGLPRLTATSKAWNLGVPTSIQIQYKSFVLKDLAGIRVRRQTAPVAGARVMVVGALAPVAGTVAIGGTSVNAKGDVRISATADPAGALPSTLVPSAALSAVVTVADGDLAVVALDTTAALPANLDVPAMQAIITAMLSPTAAGLRGGVLDLVPTGDLAMAAAPTLHVTAGTSGALTAVLAAGGHYDLRFHDPEGRAAPLTVANRVAATIAANYRLPSALRLQGRLVVGGTQVLSNASVQILCDACTGIDREKPIAEVASDENGAFGLAVPDPGTR